MLLLCFPVVEEVNILALETQTATLGVDQIANFLVAGLAGGPILHTRVAGTGDIKNFPKDEPTVLPILPDNFVLLLCHPLLVFLFLLLIVNILFDQFLQIFIQRIVLFLQLIEFVELRLHILLVGLQLTLQAGNVLVVVGDYLLV